ncbi:hypothetical protein NCER_100415 [Vairimorpha ceranae BRL01]|uniref:Uncharacterized protein n=1 Tax=Vairimorpha ceranae (strain BRL01) TaxID=578460 RepID=C4V7I4_VAIC1|nr:hypothetical protein NCER_100415 [Vairimorpha ceranae BRL01]
MPQNNFVEQHIKKYGRQLDYEVKKLKKEARADAILGRKIKKLHGIKAKLFTKKRRNEKIQLKKILILKKIKTKISSLKMKVIPFHISYLIENYNNKEKNLIIKLNNRDKIEQQNIQYPFQK